VASTFKQLLDDASGEFRIIVRALPAASSARRR
jgi:hypothetical protein